VNPAAIENAYQMLHGEIQPSPYAGAAFNVPPFEHQQKVSREAADFDDKPALVRPDASVI
jgi:hypothetical protein